MMKRYCLACDLKDNSDLIEKYKRYHYTGNVWPEITESIKSAGILDMQIFLTGNRLFMIIEVSNGFDFDRKAKMDANNLKVQEWEMLMNKYQQFLPWAGPNEKWLLMDQIFQL